MCHMTEEYAQDNKDLTELDPVLLSTNICFIFYTNTLVPGCQRRASV